MPGLPSADPTDAVFSITWIGVVLALVGAVFLSFGAQFQHKGVELVEQRHGSGAKQGLSIRQLTRLAGQPARRPRG